MLDLLAKNSVMVGDDNRQKLTDPQVYLVGDERTDQPTTLTISVGPSLSEAADVDYCYGEVEITIADLADALTHLGYILGITNSLLPERKL